jgi:uncharacterized membrane protein
MFYYIGTAIFAVLAILVVVAFFKVRAREKNYEHGGH